MLTLVVSHPAAELTPVSAKETTVGQEVNEEAYSDQESIACRTEAIVKLHMVLLDQLSDLADPATPFEEKPGAVAVDVDGV